MTAPSGGVRYYVPASAVILPARVCAILIRHSDLKAFGEQKRGADAQFDAVIDAIRVAAAEYASTANGTHSGADIAGSGELQRVGVTEAAGLLGISPRGVRAAIARDRLPAEQVGGRWLIRTADLSRYREHAA